MVASSPWPERDAELIALAGQSGEQIATAMRLSLGSVNGRLGRLKARGLIVARPAPVHQGGPRHKNPDGISPKWPAEAVAFLRAEWPSSRLTRVQIAEALGKGLGAVGQKASALGLYRPEGTPRGPAPRRVVPLALNRPLAAVPKRAPPLALDRPLAPPPREPAYQPPPPPKYGRIIDCCWPIGEPGSPGFRYCDEPSERGYSYCAEHHRRAASPARGHTAPSAGTGALLAGMG
jgi:GcrA cell cycle regulator